MELKKKAGGTVGEEGRFRSATKSLLFLDGMVSHSVGPVDYLYDTGDQESFDRCYVSN